MLKVNRENLLTLGAIILAVLLLLCLCIRTAEAVETLGWHAIVHHESGAPVGTNVFAYDSMVVYSITGVSETNGRLGTGTHFIPVGFDTTAYLGGEPAFRDTLNPFWYFTVLDAAGVTDDQYAPGLKFIAYFRAIGTSTEFWEEVQPVFVPSHVKLVDSLTEEISISSSDIDAIAAEVDTTLTAAHGSGSWASALAGVGPDTVNVYVYSYADTTPVGGVAVWLYPNDGGTPWKNTSNANGLAAFGLDDDTLYAYTWSTGYYQTTVPDTLRVTGDTSFTIYVTPQTAGASPSPALTTVDFYFYDAVGNPIPDVAMTYVLESNDGDELQHLDSAKLILVGPVGTAFSNDSGLAQINVIPNDSIVVAPNILGTTRYRVDAKNPITGLHLFGEKGILINVTASATAKRYPQDF